MSYLTYTFTYIFQYAYSCMAKITYFPEQEVPVWDSHEWGWLADANPLSKATSAPSSVQAAAIFHSATDIAPVSAAEAGGESLPNKQRALSMPSTLSAALGRRVLKEGQALVSDNGLFFASLSQIPHSRPLWWHTWMAWGGALRYGARRITLRYK